MTNTGTTQGTRIPHEEESRLISRLEQGSAEPVETLPLWPLVLLLAEIAARVEHEQAAASLGKGELREDAARSNGHEGTRAAHDRGV